MKTRDRVLHTSLALFNEEGEEQTTTLDIANEMGISPGNLYYHFRGKDEIIAELYHQYHTALATTLRAPVEQPLSAGPGNVERNWYYLYVVLEEMYQYRFLYHNLDNILQRYPDIRGQFRRLVQLKRASLDAICQTLLQQSILETGEQQLPGLVENMTLSLTFWLSYDQLLHGHRDPALTIHQGVLQLLAMIAPYLGDDQRAFYRDCEAIYASMLASGG
ncbi:TetR/AcrR family transcriptional regulator [Mangrovimicrobium sediminis]|uniref:TetR/AcrR family transcriptional regulator n=1 Tax=Mangrovimicrobium sediminis TaxID=2562682 RepID=A0A4Z0M433_9GAMM|nr:TetR/AcrR family transcriptional regulator [Haliea sp. SAOS-164]TGD74279.1 TetR/AcrR family transcriptional regulator [Haliea sp. SAOS-164]